MGDFYEYLEPSLNKMSNLLGLFFHNPTDQEKAALADNIRNAVTAGLGPITSPEAIPEQTNLPIAAQAKTNLPAGTQAGTQVPPLSQRLNSIAGAQTPTQSTTNQQKNLPELPKMPQFDWAGFMKILASPYATPAGIQYILNAGFNLYKSMLEDYNAKLNTYKAVASAENPTVTKALQILPSMYAGANKLMEIMGTPGIPDEVKLQAAVEFARRNKKIEQMERAIGLNPTEPVNQAVPINNQTAPTNNWVNNLTMPTNNLIGNLSSNPTAPISYVVNNQSDLL